MAPTAYTAARDADLPVFDGHNDTLLALYTADGEAWRSFVAGRESGALDLPRAKAGGMNGGFCAVFVPNVLTPRRPSPAGPDVSPDRTHRRTEPAIEHAYAAHHAGAMVSMFSDILDESDDELRLVLEPADLDACLSEGRFGVVLHFEGAEAIDPDLTLLDEWYERGLRSLGICWSRPNAFGTGVPFRFPSSPDVGPGLTDAGRALVRACNERGILIDLAHLNERGFRDVAEITDAPLVVTHTAAHAICPAARNLTDWQIDAVGDTGGVIGVTFFIGDLRPDGKREPHTSLDVLVRHVRYLVDRIGIDHVALGSDFDGAMMPNDLRDAAALPALIHALRADGFSNEELVDLTHMNWVRVLHETWRAAE